MEEFQPQIEQPAQAHTHKQKGKGNKGKTAGLVILIILLMAASAFGGWWYRDKQAKDQARQKDQEIATLKTQNADLTKQLEEAKKTTSEEEIATIPPQKVLDDVEAAITSKNYAALGGYMAKSVNVIIAASEGLGKRTPAEAVKDVEYLKSAQDPWNFDLSDETLNEYSTGDYAAYFPVGVLAGQSKDNKVVAFTFNTEGKISTIFMSSDADLL